MKISELTGSEDLLSPLTMPIKQFKFDRASGPNGCKNIDGSNKDEYKDLPPTSGSSKPNVNPFDGPLPTEIP